MSLLLKNARIIDGRGGIMENGWITIRGDRIADMGSGDTPPSLHEAPHGEMQTCDLKGQTVIPGLIDCHVHLGHDASADPHKSLLADPDPIIAIKTAVNARHTLAAGITTVRDLGSRNNVNLHVRDAVADGLIPGPRILACGRMICMTGGHGWVIGLEADGPHEIRKAVRTLAKQGADVVKFMATGGVLTPGVEPGAPQLTLEELTIGVKEAHRAMRPTAAHAQGREGVLAAVTAGVDSVEHGIYLDDEIMDMMLARGTFLVPTLSAPLNILANGKEAGIPEFIIEKTKRVADDHMRSLEKARQAGILIAMGTDAGTPFNCHGRNAEELLFLTQHGFSAPDALLCATSMAARLLGMEKEIGSIGQGMKADLVVLNADPLTDISTLSDSGKIVAVYKGGLRTAGTGPGKTSFINPDEQPIKGGIP